jgi:hypothetical protein
MTDYQDHPRVLRGEGLERLEGVMLRCGDVESCEVRGDNTLSADMMLRGKPGRGVGLLSLLREIGTRALVSSFPMCLGKI